jgi:hypothetical protein
MPLKNGCDYKIVRENVSKLVQEGRPLKQAVAIALDHAREQGCDVKKIQSSALEEQGE